MSQKAGTEEFYLALLEFLLQSKRRIIDLGASLDLTAMQTMMLFMLNEPQPMYRFKKTLNCDASNVTGLVDGLEHKQLASRFEHPDDRRIKMVKLTAKGQQTRTALLSRLSSHHNPMLDRLSPAEIETFTTFVHKLNTEPTSINDK